MTQLSTVQDNKNYTKYLDHGFIGLAEVMGSDKSIEDSARMSYQGQDESRTLKQSTNLLRYLLRNGHTSPFEMAEVRFHLKMPIIVARQMIRHRTANVNEQSGRYTELTDEFYIPELSRIQEQSSDNKQGSGEALNEDMQNHITGLIKCAEDFSYSIYDELLEKNFTRELARGVLPTFGYTEFYWKCDLHNVFHFLNLRLHEHAQKEIRDLAQGMYDLIKPRFPISCEAFEDYTLNSKRFSVQEMQILKDALENVDIQVIAEKFQEKCAKFSKRELREFMHKLS